MESAAKLLLRTRNPCVIRRQDRGSGQFRFEKALFTDNPSLRAHSSNPAGGRLQSKPAGEVIVSCQYLPSAPNLGRRPKTSTRSASAACAVLPNP